MKKRPHNGQHAPRLLGGAFVLWLLLATSGSALGTSGVGTEIIVRIDDRERRTLAQPWISVQLSDQNVLSAPAFDNSSDPLDRFAGDRLYFGRIEAGGTGSATVFVTDGGPVGVGRLVERSEVSLSPGGTIHVQVGSLPRASRGTELPEVATGQTGSSPTTTAPPSTERSGWRSLWSREEGPPEVPWPEHFYSFQDAEWSWRPWVYSSLGILLLLWAQRWTGALSAAVAARLQGLRRALSRAAPRPRGLRRDRPPA